MDFTEDAKDADWLRHNCLTIIAEVGLNHNGSVEQAIELAKVSKEAGCDSVKFQLRSDKSFLNIQGHRDIGSEIVDDYIHKTFIDYEGYLRIWQACDEIGINAFFSVWDIESLHFAESLGVSCYKVGSADMTNTILIDQLIKTGKPLLVSTGMSCEEEVDSLVSTLNASGSKYGLLHCHSAYPAPPHHLNLSYLLRLRSKTSCPIGYSSHDLGCTASILSIALGSTILEKHVTLDRSAYGNDHSVSLEPNELKAYVKECRTAYMMLGTSGPRTVGPGEKFNRLSLAKSVITRKPAAAGERLSPNSLEFYPSGEGLTPGEVSLLMGNPIVSDIKSGDLITRSLFRKEHKTTDLSYLIKGRLIGFPVRYRDIVSLGNSIDASYLEIHMSYRDMFVLPPKEIGDLLYGRRIGFHAPDIYADNLIFDPISPNKEHSIKSIEGFNVLCEHISSFHATHKLQYRINLVTSFSSYTESAHNTQHRGDCYCEINAFIDEYHRLYPKIHILPQTLPALAWYLGGQRYVNTFSRPEEIVDFVNKYNKSICLDISHLFMACNYYGDSFEEYSAKLKGFATHFHLAGASGIDDEGLSLTLTKSMHSFLKELLNNYLYDRSAIVETWQGHLNHGEGFKKDLDFLSSLLHVK